MLDQTLVGSSEANERLKRMVNQKNSGKVEYPSGTNERGYPSKREHHASGDMVGGAENDVMRGVSALKSGGTAPGRGGSRMAPHFGAPEGGQQNGAPRRMAVRQAQARI